MTTEIRLPSKDEDSLRRICRLIESDVEPEAEEVRNIVVSYGREDQTIPLGDGLRCSVNVLKELACGYGFGGNIEPAVLEKNVGCLQMLLKRLRR